MKNAVPKAQDADAKPYQPTRADARAFQAYMAERKKAAPRLKVVPGAQGAKRIAVDHPNEALGQITLMKALGTTDEDFLAGLVRQLVDAGSQGTTPDERETNFMLAVVKGIEPHDQIEAMLAAQMAAVHNATMTFARRLARVENIQQQDSAQTAFNKLARTFAAQVEALKNYRSKGEQKMTVQHVHVAEGGQAIVGTVNAPAEGVGAKEKTGGSTPCSWICAGHRDATPSRSGAGSSAERQPFGGLASAGCTGPLAGLLGATGTP